VPDLQNPAAQEGVSLAKTNEQVTVEVVPRHLRMHNISESELDALTSDGSTLNLTFFGICFGAFVSFAVVLYTGGVTDPTKHATFSMLTFSCLLMSAFFGIRGVSEYLSWQKKRSEMKSELISKKAAV
jgi:hypothetical protein